MKNADYRKILSEEMFEPIMELTERKSHDYAGEGDTLSNFKIQAQMQSKLLGYEVSPAEVALQFVIVKLVRLANLKGKEPRNESVLDTIRDAINYLGLHYACRIDENCSVKGSRKWVDNVTCTMPGCISEEIVK